MKTILVVEDNDDLPELVSATLRRAGYDVAEAENGQAAREVISAMQQPPGLVLLDLMMPVMSGAELLQELRQAGKPAALPVVLLSAVADRYQPEGARRYVRKPVSEEVLPAVVREFC